MAAAQKRTFDLPAEQAAYIDALVEAGSYASESEVILAGLEALQDRGEDMERWLREEVVPVAAAMDADPSRGIAAEQVLANLRARHAQQKSRS